MQYTLKKSLGQHFLKDENISRKIVVALQQGFDNTGIKQLLEVGPGGGALTKYLLQLKEINFKAVELDAEKIIYLEQNYPSIKDKIIHQNFLDIDAPFKTGTKAYGILSVLVQAFYTVEYLFDVPPGCFTPPPKVMSGVIRFKLRTTKFEVRSEKAFFTLVKRAFNQRRKTLRNAVRTLFDESILKEDIFNKRAEQLSIEDFATLTFKMK